MYQRTQPIQTYNMEALPIQTLTDPWYGIVLMNYVVFSMHAYIMNEVLLELHVAGWSSIAKAMDCPRLDGFEVHESCLSGLNWFTGWTLFLDWHIINLKKCMLVHCAFTQLTLLAWPGLGKASIVESAALNLRGKRCVTDVMHLNVCCNCCICSWKCVMHLTVCCICTWIFCFCICCSCQPQSEYSWPMD